MKAIKPTMEATNSASRWLWIRRSDLWARAAGTKARVLSMLAGSPDRGSMMLKDLKYLITSGNITDECFPVQLKMYL